MCVKKENETSKNRRNSYNNIIVLKKFTNKTVNVKKEAVVCYEKLCQLFGTLIIFYLKFYIYERTLNCHYQIREYEKNLI